MYIHPDSNRIHYTVDRIENINTFTVCLYHEDQVKSVTSLQIRLEDISKLLQEYSRLGYIADRIAF